MRAWRLRLLAPALFAVAGAWSGDARAADFRVEDGGIAEPLTDVPGNPARGAVIVRDVRNVTCLICHSMPIPDEPDQGEIGPPLAGVGSRLSAAELRLRLVNPKLLNPDTIMPAYYWTEGLNRVDRAHLGETIYSAQEIEDVVAYLAALVETGQ